MVASEESQDGALFSLRSSFTKDRFFFRSEGATWKEILGTPSRFARCLSPRVLLMTRVVLFMLSLGLMIWSSVSEVLKGQYGRWWIFLMHWTLAWQTLYLCFGAASTALALHSTVPDGKGDATPWFASVTWAMQGTAMVWSILVFALYWLLGYKPGVDVIDALNLCAHGGNWLLVLADVLLTCNPWHLVHIVMPVFYGTVYLLFTVLYQVVKDDYIYDVLDWSKPDAAAQLGCIIVFAAVPFTWSLFWLVATCRKNAPQHTDENATEEKVQPDALEFDV